MRKEILVISAGLSALLLTACMGGMSNDTASSSSPTVTTQFDESGSNPQIPLDPGPLPAGGGSVCGLSEAALMPAGFQLQTQMGTGDQLHIADVSGRSPVEIVSPTGFPIFVASDVAATTSMVAAPDGAELHVRLTNNSGIAKPLGRLNISGLHLGTAFTFYNISQGTEPMQLSYPDNSVGIVATNLIYPGDIYSPVALVQTGTHTIGMSLNYPLLQYKHQVAVYLVRGAHQSLWTMFMHLDGEIPAGEQREYVLNIRVLPRSEHLMKVLIPYRDYFQATYGGVQYTRDGRPVRGIVAAYSEYQTPENPLGFSPTQPRPDLFGYGAWANTIKTLLPATGYHRAMFWSTAGLYANRNPANYPYQFMTHILQEPAMAGSLDALRAIPSADLAMGYWWGHAGSVVTDWENPVGHAMNPYDPADLALGYAEYDMAVDLGATLIGLDAIGGMPDWDSYVWVGMMKQRAPQVFFVGELSISDVLHTIMGTWLRGDTITRDNLMADFLNPGHESWLSDGNGSNFSAEQMVHAGFTPMLFSGRAVDASIVAEPSWLRTIPLEMRLCSGGSTH